VKRLLLDAGPLIAIFSPTDEQHGPCRAGLEKLVQMGTELILPLPILYEVHKWLSQRVSPNRSIAALELMQRNMRRYFVTEELYESVLQFRRGLPNWNGTLEDATVAVLSLRIGCPVWTLDYRDLGIFPKLRFWNP
jgi:predicted nucleic acid-binding protein